MLFFKPIVTCYYSLVKKKDSPSAGLQTTVNNWRIRIMASISCRHVKKVYPGNVVAVPDFSLEIADKEFIVFVGPSGCGNPPPCV